MKARIATVFTALALIGGTGGAVALAHGAGSHGKGAGAEGAEYKQYRPGKGCGDRNHRHTGSHGKKQRPCPKPSHD
jgi:hypothetical protein